MELLAGDLRPNRHHVESQRLSHQKAERNSHSLLEQYGLSQYPNLQINQGPGRVAALPNARLENISTRVRCHPPSPWT